MTQNDTKWHKMTQDDTRWHEQLEAFILALGAETLACARVSHSSLHRRCKTDLQQSQAWYVDIMCIIMCITMCIIALHLLQQVFPWSTVRGGRLVNNRLKHVREREREKKKDSAWHINVVASLYGSWVCAFCRLFRPSNHEFLPSLTPSWPLMASYESPGAREQFWQGTGNGNQWQWMAMNGNEWQWMAMNGNQFIFVTLKFSQKPTPQRVPHHPPHQSDTRATRGREDCLWEDDARTSPL